MLKKTVKKPKNKIKIANKGSSIKKNEKEELYKKKSTFPCNGSFFRSVSGRDFCEACNFCPRAKLQGPELQRDSF